MKKEILYKGVVIHFEKGKDTTRVWFEDPKTGKKSGQEWDNDFKFKYKDFIIVSAKRTIDSIIRK